MQQAKFCTANPRTRSKASRFATRSSAARFYRVSGFTMVELIITIAVLAIIAVIAAPSFIDIITRKKLQSASDDLISQVREARSQAVLLRDSTIVCLGSFPDDSRLKACLKTLTGTDSTDVSQDYEENKERIFLVHLDKSIVSNTNSALKFRQNGSIQTSTNFLLTRDGLSSCVTVGMIGDIKTTELDEEKIQTGACT